MKGINTMKVTRMMMGMAAVVAGLLFSSLAHAGDAPITPSVVRGDGQLTRPGSGTINSHGRVALTTCRRMRSAIRKCGWTTISIRS